MRSLISLRKLILLAFTIPSRILRSGTFWVFVFAIVGGGYFLIISQDWRLGYDANSYFYARYVYIKNSIERFGQIPLWYSTTHGGYNLHAEPISSQFYPLITPFLLLLPTVESAANWSVFLHILLLGIFSYKFFKSTGINKIGSLAGSIFLMFYGRTAIILSASGGFNSIYPIPYTFLVLWSLDEIFRGNRKFWLGLATSISMFVLSGGGAVFLYSAFVWVFFTIYKSLISLKFGVKKLISIYTIIIFGLLMGVGLSGVKLLPTLDYFGSSTHSEVPLGQPEERRLFELKNIYQIFVGDVSSIKNKAGFGFEWELDNFIGYSGIILALIGLIFSKRSSLKIFSAMSFAFFILVSFGEGLPIDLYKLIYDYVPSAKALKMVIRFTQPASHSLIILSALGAEVSTKVFFRLFKKYYLIPSFILLFAILSETGWHFYKVMGKPAFKLRENILSPLNSKTRPSGAKAAYLTDVHPSLDGSNLAIDGEVLNTSDVKWLKPGNHPGSVFVGATLENIGSTLAPIDNDVEPGNRVKFSIKYSIPSVQPSRESSLVYLGMALDKATWFNGSVQPEQGTELLVFKIKFRDGKPYGIEKLNESGSLTKNQLHRSFLGYAIKESDKEPLRVSGLPERWFYEGTYFPVSGLETTVGYDPSPPNIYEEAFFSAYRSDGLTPQSLTLAGLLNAKYYGGEEPYSKPITLEKDLVKSGDWYFNTKYFKRVFPSDNIVIISPVEDVTEKELSRVSEAMVLSPFFDPKKYTLVFLDHSNKKFESKIRNLGDFDVIVSKGDKFSLFEEAGKIRLTYTKNLLDVNEDINRTISGIVAESEGIFKILEKRFPKENIDHEVSVDYYSPDRVIYKIVTSGPSRLINIGNLYDKNWAVYFDGQLRPLISSNRIITGIFSLTPFPPGTHKIEMIFRPKSFVIGLYVTLFATSVVLAYIIYQLLSKLKKPQTI